MGHNGDEDETKCQCVAVNTTVLLEPLPRITPTVVGQAGFEPAFLADRLLFRSGGPDLLITGNAVSH